MSKLTFKYVPLTFISSKEEIQRQIRNTIVFSYLQRQYDQVHSFSEILESTQYGLNAAANSSGKHKFLRISDIKEGQVNWDTVPMCVCDDKDTYKLYKDDILVARTGGTTGKSFLIDEPPSNAVFAGYLIRLRAKSISPKIIYEFLNSYAYWSQISEMKMGSAQPNVNAQKLKKLQIPLAPDDVLQQVEMIFSGKANDLQGLSGLIRRGLSNYDKSFDLKGIILEQRDLLAQLRQGVLQEAVQGKLTAQWRSANPSVRTVDLDSLEASRQELQLQASKARGQKSFKYKPGVTIEIGGKSKGVDDLFDLPNTWRWASLGQLSWSINDGPHFSPKYVDSGVPMLSARNISFKNGLDFRSAKFVSAEDHNEFTKRGVPMIGDVILSKGGTTGIPAVIESSVEFSIWVHLALIKLISDYVDPYYMRYALASPYVYRQSQAQTHGIGNKDLGLTRMIYFAIPYPPVEEQQAIVKQVKSLMTLCDKLEQEIENSQTQIEQLMQSCLKEVFN